MVMMVLVMFVVFLVFFVMVTDMAVIILIVVIVEISVIYRAGGGQKHYRKGFGGMLHGFSIAFGRFFVSFAGVTVVVIAHSGHQRGIDTGRRGSRGHVDRREEGRHVGDVEIKAVGACVDREECLGAYGGSAAGAECEERCDFFHFGFSEKLKLNGFI